MRHTSHTLQHATPPRHGGAAIAPPRRGGAVIILSLAMLMSLLFLGLFFFSFVDDESRSADIYARQSQPTITVSNRHVLNHGLSQVTVGTNDSDPNEPYFAPFSALFGGRYSMLAHIIGPIGEHDWDRSFVSSGTMSAPDPTYEDFDGDGYFDPWTPTNYELFSGSGVRPFWDGTQFQIDTNNDGAADVSLGGAPGNSLRLHAGPLADAAGGAFDPTQPKNVFTADVGYTYPDLNALFIYHQTALSEDDNLNALLDPGEDRNGNGILDFYRAIKPSFEAPAVLYGRGTAAPSYVEPDNDIAMERVLRPHFAHSHVGGSRYITGIPGTDPVTGRTVPVIEPNYLLELADYDDSGTYVDDEKMGIWNRLGTVDADTYEFHADADGDGENDAFLIDLDYPLIEFPDGRNAVPLYFWRIEDLDALVNLNTAGDMPLYRVAERVGRSRANVLTGILGESRYLTGANYGLSVSEINPGVPLRSDTTNTGQFDVNSHVEAADQFNRYYNEQAGLTPITPGSPVPAERLAIANTELLWLMTGRHQYDAAGTLPEDYDLAGRYGELLGIDKSSAMFPAAGNTGVDSQGQIYDDDGDSNRGPQPNGGAAYQEWFRIPFGDQLGRPQISGAVTMPPAVHPLDGSGFAEFLEDAAGMPSPGKRRRRSDGGLGSGADQPNQWLTYEVYDATSVLPAPLNQLWSFWQSVNPLLASQTGVAPWDLKQASLIPDGFVPNIDLFWDEPDEMVVDDSDPHFLNPADQPFPASEITALFASDADWTRLNTTSRLRDLAPINFTINFLAEQIRRQFTTVSWDRPEFGAALSGLRTWEWDRNGNNALDAGDAFPPRFGMVGATPPNYASGGIVATDPLRPELRRLLHVDYYSSRGNRHPQHRLQLNGILSDDSLGGAGAVSCFDKNGNPRFRPLVPHPVFNSATDAAFTPQGMLHNNGTAVPTGHQFAAIGTSKEVQEWWARHDRQRLARDIYTLLWMIGPRPDLDGNGTIDSNDNPCTSGYNATGPWPDSDMDGIADVVIEMAQFAVNVVDAMDHDGVITRFEFDPDLTDGWDNAAEYVYGVEAQSLTFSETLWINAQRVMNGGSGFDHPATIYDDGNGDHQFMYIELRNALPLDVKLASDSYRIERHELVGGTPTLVAGCTVTFDMPLATADVVGPGQNYIIGTHTDSTLTGGSGVLASDFRLDFDADAGATTDIEYEAVIPAWTETTGGGPPGGTGNDVATARAETKAPLVDFDLCHPDDRATGMNFEEHGSAIGYFLQNGGSLTTAGNCDLVLKRRMNPQADGVITVGMPDDGSNDWIEIDRITITRREFTINATDAATAVQSMFRTNVRSEERQEPFYAYGNGLGVEIESSSNAFFKHSLGGVDLGDSTNTDGALQTPTTYVANPKPATQHQRNTVLPTGQKFQIWQPHFDRGFTSVYDMLSVLTIGPQSLIYHDRTSGSVEGGLVVTGSTRMMGVHSAGVRFLNPMDDTEPGFPTHLNIPEITGEHYANRWYRLFEFLSVSSHTSDEVADRMASRHRVPGKINVNTVRHEHDFAAAINDRDQLDLIDPYFPANDRFMGSSPNIRNWYTELRRSRDGVNSALGDTIYPPGTPFSNPFRPLTYEDARDFNTANPGVQPFPNAGQTSINSTILRMHAATAGSSLPNIGLFEARNPSDVTADTIDWHTRQRILSRIANLTTNRSHVYVIWGGFQLHDAYEATPNDDVPNVRIGARLTAEPVYRELIVVDMSRLEEAYDTATGAFNFEGFILHREVLP